MERSNTFTTCARSFARTLRRLRKPGRARGVAVALAWVVCASAVLAPVAPALAASTAPRTTIESISEAARQFADQNGLKTAGRRSIVVSPLDTRLRFAPCPVALATAAAPGVRSSLRMTVEVRCPAPGGGWRLFVPVRIEAFDSAVVAVRALPRGHVIAGSDVSVVESDVSGLPAGYASDAGRLIGRRVARPVNAGSVLGSSTLVPDLTVRRGQTVTLLAQTRGLSIRAQGMALTGGGVDEHVRIKNLSSGREIEGIVRSAGVVEITLP